MDIYTKKLEELKGTSYSWLITGVAGFIGSNLLEALLKLDQKVVGLDNFATGYEENLKDVKSEVSEQQWSRFNFIQGDIKEIEICHKVSKNIDFVLHQAALGSVPRSIKDPIATNEVNVNGFLNMLIASKEANVKSFVYAASSSTYGDHPDLPKVEPNIGKPLSPYAITKYVNELYANIFNRIYGFSSIGLRYFNVFGKRQDPNGSYAAVIPKWIGAMLNSEKVFINGDGTTSRDFCFIENAVQANILSALLKNNKSSKVYNVAVGDRTDLNSLFSMLKSNIQEYYPDLIIDPVYKDFREGDVLHSQASIDKAQKEIGYSPEFKVVEGLANTVSWYVKRVK